MDTIETILEMNTANGLPLEIWYALTIILAGVLVWIIKDFIQWLKAAVVELKESVWELKEIVRMHAKDILDNKSDIEEVKKDIRELRNKPNRR